MAMRGPRHPIGAAPWIAEERATALQISQSEVDEFAFSAKNELDWLNEHMADIFSENKIHVADIFKTPGKLRGKTPRTARKDMRAPLTDVFSSTPKNAPNPFAVSKLPAQKQQFRRLSPSFRVAEDRPSSRRTSRKSPSPRVTRPKTAAALQKTATTKAAKAKQIEQVPSSLVDSGYHGSQPQDVADEDKENQEMEEEDELAAGPSTPEQRPASRKAVVGGVIALDAKTNTTILPVALPGITASQTTQPATDDASFHSAKEEQVVAPPEVPITAVHATTTTTTTRQVLFSSPMLSNDAGSSPFCPVRASTAAPNQLPKSSSPAKPAAPASPVRKPVPQPSSPLQSTTPACPPPKELLAARDGGFAPAASAILSPALGHMRVPPAVPTPPTTSTPVFIAAQRAADVEIAPQLSGDEDIVIAEDDDVDDDVDAEIQLHQEEEEQQTQHLTELAQSPSDPSTSPVRPIVRKSSINFASLPAREPFTSNKSMGGGMSRISHIDSGRTSYYNRPTGGKSLGNNMRAAEPEKEAVKDEVMHDGETTSDADEDAAIRSKTYAQRLHDRISMLGKSQANGMRPSKSLATHLPGQNPLTRVPLQQQTQQTQPTPKKAAQENVADDEEQEEDDWITPPPIATAKSMATDIVREPAATAETNAVVAASKEIQQAISRPASPIRKPLPSTALERTPGHSKSNSVPSLPIEDAALATTATKPVSVSNPTYPTLAAVYETTDRPPTPSKSPMRNYRDSPLKQVKNKLSSILKSSKGLLASSAAISAEGKSSLLMSPSQARLGLLAGPSTESLMYKARSDSASESRPDLARQISASTTASAESATDARSPYRSPVREGSPLRVLRKTRASTERERREEKQREREEKETQRMAEQMEKLEKMREKEREKARVFSAEQARLAAEQAERERVERERVERAERERAERVERERVERAERERAERAEKEERERAEQEEREERERREQELRERQQQKQRQQQQRQQQQQKQKQQREEEEDVEMPPPTPAPRSPVKTQASSPARVPVKSARVSPRKATKTPQAANIADAEMADAPSAPASMLPPAPASSTASSVPRATQAGRTIRRPLKPTKEAPAKTRQAPTVIRVNTSSSQQQHHQHQPSAQFHPSNSVLAANLHETLAGPPQAQPHASLRSKASAASLHTKPSLQSLKSSVSSTGRPKALELAAKRKEQEEREAQRKRDAKADIERKRAAAQEQEEQRRQEAKKQREREQAAAEAAAAAKKAAAAQQRQERQAALERAKQTRAPPPASRTQLPGLPSTEQQQQQQQQPPRPASRLATAASSMVHRSQEELHRPVNAVLSNTGKALQKRALPGVDAYDGGHGHGHSSRPGTAAGGMGQQVKRMRMSEEFDEDELEMGGTIPRASNIKGPPIRPSNGFKKELNKSVFGNGYATAPASAANVSRDLFKATVTTQHNHQARAGHPMDMAQVSKAPISFASHGNNAAASVAAAAAAAAASTVSAPAPANAHKTPLRPVGAALASKSTAKSTGKAGAKSSPRVPNGDGIELPEIQTDDEDSEDESHGNVAPWADSPDLRRALMRQETVDPFQVFGPPGPLNMEEVFNKSKERWGKFRARTSSANWSGADRLTEEDIRKDLAARDKIRREGGWSYDLSRDLA